MIGEFLFLTLLMPRQARFDPSGLSGGHYERSKAGIEAHAVINKLTICYN